MKSQYKIMIIIERVSIWKRHILIILESYDLKKFEALKKFYFKEIG